MTTLHKFLNFNKHCPLCNNPLTLYMQWIDAPLYKAIGLADDSDYYFTKFNTTSFDNSEPGEKEDERAMTLIDYGDSFETIFSDVSLFHEAKKYQMYFYFLCSASGFKSKGLKNYDINLAKGCYYRSTPLMEFVKDDSKNWNLTYSIKESSDLVNKDESFCLKTYKEGINRFYLLSRDMETQTTKAWHFSMTDKERVDPTFKPNIWRQEFPLIERPSMDNQKKILHKIQSWITLS